MLEYFQKTSIVLCNVSTLKWEEWNTLVIWLTILEPTSTEKGSLYRGSLLTSARHLTISN